MLAEPRVCQDFCRAESPVWRSHDDLRQEVFDYARGATYVISSNMGTQPHSQEA
jgi:hypothetical protein